MRAPVLLRDGALRCGLEMRAEAQHDLTTVHELVEVLARRLRHQAVAITGRVFECAEAVERRQCRGTIRGHWLRDVHGGHFLIRVTHVLLHV